MTALRTIALFAAAIASAGFACTNVHAQAWPSRTVRVIVPFQPGGGTDTQSRLLGKKLTENLGQSFVVDNRSGAGGLIGAELAAKAPPDGYTLLFTTASLSVQVTLVKKLAFDPLKDLAPVSLFSSAPLVLVVHPSVPAKTVPELVALAKKSKSKLNAASNGSGTTSHLAIEMLKQAAGIDVVHVPYKGGGPAVTAMMAGEVDLRFSGQLAVLPHVRSGRVRAIAIASTRRSTLMPDVPTLASYYPGFDADNWYAMFAPAAIPKDIVTRLHGEIVKVLKAPDMRETIARDGAEPIGSTPDELAAYFRKEADKYAKVIRAAKITSE
ncbi:MAG TPA: tripartite tricarboxylate transporter substrate binding protein [Burkholderiales bacterium]|nr:tripartite tricarboxylate transporter substrate binding protein [Burkholderiales bacterium]